MKILVFINMVPFVHGGAEELAAHLVANLKRLGHKAEAIKIPFSWEPAGRIIEEMLLCRNLRVGKADAAIALKFPAYLIPHENKVFWLLHQYRQAYDLWDAGMSNIPKSEEGERLRRYIASADNIAFGEARKIFTNSKTTSERLKRYNNFDSSVLPPPLNDPEIFTGGGQGGYIFAGGRVNSAKRQYLLIKALRYARNVKLIIAGPPDDDAEADKIKKLVSEEGLEDRVFLDLRFLSREEVAGYVNNANAVAYLPFDEDSVGYVTMEAFQARKPVITAEDSGGVLDIVKNEESGWVVRDCFANARNDGEELGKAMQEAVTQGKKTAEKGENARKILDSLGLNWDNTINRLLG